MHLSTIFLFGWGFFVVVLDCSSFSGISKHCWIRNYHGGDLFLSALISRTGDDELHWMTLPKSPPALLLVFSNTENFVWMLSQSVLSFMHTSSTPAGQENWAQTNIFVSQRLLARVYKKPSIKEQERLQVLSWESAAASFWGDFTILISWFGAKHIYKSICWCESLKYGIYSVLLLHHHV